MHSRTRDLPDQERIVLIKDAAEIQIQKPNILRFEARREQNDLPPVTIRDLLKATLCHRPDRIILGEIRGGEAFDLLQLLNTGHGGTISTSAEGGMHAAHTGIRSLTGSPKVGSIISVYWFAGGRFFMALRSDRKNSDGSQRLVPSLGLPRAPI